MKPVRTILVLALLLTAFAFLPHPVAAAEEDDPLAYLNHDDAAFLQMYFSEDQLFETATRYKKPLTKVPENVSIITADEIEAMNAHTVIDVLNRAPGVFIQFDPDDFGSGSSGAFIHGSQYEHVLVLFDGIRWGLLADQITYLNNIPVQAIDRIEIIKGAASSTWGSALGGVINIITKKPASSKQPLGMVSASIGEQASQEFRGELTGKPGRIGYYLTATNQSSNGIRGNRFFDNNGLYGKLTVDLPKHAELVLAFGTAAPEFRRIDAYYYDAWETAVTNEIESEYHFYTAHLNLPLTDTLFWDVQAGRRHNDLASISWYSAFPGLYTTEFDEITTSISSRLAWNHNNHGIIIGAEYERGEEDDRFNDYQAATIYDETYALYVNDTIQLNDLTLVPGLRLDHFLNSDEIISPSLGGVYRFSDSLLFRAGISRGFRRPTIGFLKGDPNVYGAVSPELESEKIWTYQAGVETMFPRLGHLKTTLFLHDSEDTWRQVDGIYTNTGNAVWRYGLEVELETIAFHHLSLTANGTYVYLNRDGDRTSSEAYNAKIILRYDDPESLNIQLFGNYVWWGTVLAPPSYVEKDGNFVWELTATKTIITIYADLELFASIHNLFDTDQYYDDAFINAGRWIEGGLRILF